MQANLQERIVKGHTKDWFEQWVSANVSGAENGVRYCKMNEKKLTTRRSNDGGVHKKKLNVST